MLIYFARQYIIRCNEINIIIISRNVVVVSTAFPLAQPRRQPRFQNRTPVRCPCVDDAVSSHLHTTCYPGEFYLPGTFAVTSRSSSNRLSFTGCEARVSHNTPPIRRSQTTQVPSKAPLTNFQESI